MVASEGTAVLCQPVQRTLPHLPSTQQTILLGAGQTDPKQAYPFDLLITREGEMLCELLVNYLEVHDLYIGLSIMHYPLLLSIAGTSTYSSVCSY